MCNIPNKVTTWNGACHDQCGSLRLTPVFYECTSIVFLFVQQTDTAASVLDTTTVNLSISVVSIYSNSWYTIARKCECKKVLNSYTQPLSHSTLSSATSAQVIVSEKYRKDYEDIQDRFAQLFDEVGELLENEESVTLESLKKYLSKIPEMRHLLDNAYTISDIIDIIQEHSSFTCCSHLKGVARRFNVPVAIEKIEKYHQFMNQ